VLYLGGIAWTLAYDTIYAHQDKEDDALIGLKSTALKLGAATPRWLAGFFAAALGLIALAGWLAGAGPVYHIGVAAAGVHAVWQLARLDIDDPARCLRLFRSNRDFGLLIFAAAIRRFTDQDPVSLASDMTEQRPLLDIAQDVIARARRLGADAADTIVVSGEATEVEIRDDQIESVERSEGRDLALRVFVGQSSGHRLGQPLRARRPGGRGRARRRHGQGRAARPLRRPCR
jgi:hypothetical protein